MKVLVTGAWNCTEEQLNSLQSMGNKIVFMQNEADELPCGAIDAEGIICNGLFLHHDIEKFTNLTYIQLTSAGFDRVPMDYVKQHNITIHNARGVYSVPMAEFAVCGVLQLLKRSMALMHSQQNHEWKKQRTLGELFGKTVCVVGCGSVGTEVAKRFSAFGCEIIGVDLYPREDEHYAGMYPLEDMDKAFGRADVVILTLPLTEQTQYLINKNMLKTMKQNAILVNIARGKIVKTIDLIEALQNKQLSGAMLDVFEEEPLSSDSPLWDMENVILTPHNSFVGEGNGARLWSVIKNNMEKFQ
ncbi:MAG: hydroxyacid dehydrogenase [Clostridia bacterium]|nr:hydroxyacid dehydrogenase [Clostridia bacterium]